MRFSETEYNSTAQMDFVPRERRHQVWHIVVAFMFTICLLFILSVAPGAMGGPVFAGLASMASVAVLCFYVVYRKQQSLDLVMSTEYQNMLFAQAVALGTSFCLFVRRDGTIVYANDGLRKLFPHFAYSDSQVLEGLFEQGGVRKADRERVMAAIYSSQSDRVVCPLKTLEGEQEYILTMEPLKRPGGFMVVRGREYRDKRTGTQMLPDMLGTTSMDKIQHMLSNTAVAHYITDSYGRLEYVTPALERLLGYQGGELLDGKLYIHHLLYQLGGQPVGDDYTLTDYSGEATLQKKQGTVTTAILHQSVIRDENGKPAGATGSILPHPGKGE